MPEVARVLRGQLGHRLPSRRWEHDDLVNETLLALSEWMRSHERQHRAWVDGPPTDAERDAFFGLARVILQRRIADRFRLNAREWHRRVDVDQATLGRVPSGAPSAERQVLLRRMLEITIGVLATLKPEDRDVIAIVAAGAGGPLALSPRERQRLKRARRRLVDAIIAELGSAAADLLRLDE
jgi:DNA-directed RNA polymerase specialized sigma24 family protein